MSTTELSRRKWESREMDEAEILQEHRIKKELFMESSLHFQGTKLEFLAININCKRTQYKHNVSKHRMNIV